MDHQSIRKLFLLDPGVVFLNHGSFGARPREVLEAQEALRHEIEIEPVEFLGRRSAALVEGALETLGAFLGARPRNLAFVPNATTGVNVAARSLPLAPGDEVLASDQEYGACAHAFERICAARGAVYRPVAVPVPYAGDTDFLARLEASITPRTRALFLSHITSPTALRFPVQAACRMARERGILTVIDGAHAPGQLPLDLETLGADFYAGNCHKWMCGPLGSAFLHVREERHAAIEPPVTSWGLFAEATGTAAHDAYAGTSTLARRLLWQGTRDVTAFLAVPAAIRFLARCDGPQSAARSAALAASTARRAADLLGTSPAVQEGSGVRMSLIPLPPCDGEAVQAALLSSHRIEAPITEHGGRQFLRLSFHAYNGEDDARAVLDALPALFPDGRSAV
jgi:isopenicillin-N epimerase